MLIGCWVALRSAVRVLPVRLACHGALSGIARRRRSLLAAAKRPAFPGNKGRMAAADRAGGRVFASPGAADRSREHLSVERAADVLAGAAIDGHRDEFGGAAAVRSEL